MYDLFHEIPAQVDLLPHKRHCVAFKCFLGTQTWFENYCALRALKWP